MNEMPILCPWEWVGAEFLAVMLHKSWTSGKVYAEVQAKTHQANLVHMPQPLSLCHKELPTLVLVDPTNNNA
jgi:hypothetical protein